MIKLKNILSEVMNTYQIQASMMSDRGVGITNILDQIRGLEKVTIVNNITPEEYVQKEKIEYTRVKIKFVSRTDPKADIVKMQKDMLTSDLKTADKVTQIKINKQIPNKAGLGGGSMNAANILNFLIKKKFIKLKQKKILKISRLIGSDVILGINPASTVLTSNNIITKFFNCPRFYTLLVQPNFGCSTKKIYSKVSFKDFLFKI